MLIVLEVIKYQRLKYLNYLKTKHFINGIKRNT